jgi:hydroxymethylglutaryl-CoA lyase
MTTPIGGSSVRGPGVTSTEGPSVTSTEGPSLRGPQGETPSSVRIREVGPRDGLQNEPEVVATADKVALVERLARTGLRRVEVTSFVRADVIPQLSDAEDVLRALDVPEGVARSVLVPNSRGLDHALELRDRFDEVGVFVSASETHNLRNVNRSVAASLDSLERVIARAREAGLRVEAVIATSFGCPYEGVVPRERVLEIAAQLAAAGAQEVAFGDTTGMANPSQVAAHFQAARAALGPEIELTAHFHNTRGQGLANVLAALQAGCTSFESSVGELGGCPVPPGSTGNVATEDLVGMLHEMGIATGVDLAALVEVARGVERLLGRKLGSHTLVAGLIDWDPCGGGGSTAASGGGGGAEAGAASGGGGADAEAGAASGGGGGGAEAGAASGGGGADAGARSGPGPA